MSGRPRTTSFAESCKPVQQPSAFGSMKVSREYPALPGWGVRAGEAAPALRPGGERRREPGPSPGLGSSFLSPSPPPINLE